MIRWVFAVALLALFPLGELSAQSQIAVKADASGWIDPGWRRTNARYTITFDETGSSNTIFEFEILLTDPKGLRDVAQQTFSYNSHFQKLDLSDLATIKADGRIIPVDARAINDQPAFADPSSPYYDEQRITTVAYRDVAPGDKIKGRVNYATLRPLFPGEYGHYWAQPQDRAPEVIELTLTGPASKPLQIVARGVEHTEERVGDRIVHHVFFRQETPKPVRDETNGFDGARRFEVSTFKDYAAFAAVIRAANAPMAMPDAALSRLSSDIVGDARNDRVKAERIYNWVARNIRYVGIGFEDGGFTSQPASAVLAARYGDCKAHVTILKALLAVQGIAADFVLVNLGREYTITGVATPNFDHAIVYLPQLDLYLDPTSAHTAFGSLPANLYGKPVLDTDSGALSSIPVAKPDDFMIRSNVEYTLGPDGIRKAEASLSGTGIGANVTRVFAQYLENTDRARVAGEKIQDAGLQGIGTYSFPDPRDPTPTFTISAPFVITDPVPLDKAARIRLLPATEPRRSLVELVGADTRDRAFRCLSLDYRDTASIDLPDGINLEEKPATWEHVKDLGGRTRYGVVIGRIEMSSTAVLDGRKVRTESHVRFVFDASVCPREFAADIRSAVAKWDEFKRGIIGLTPKAVSRVVERGSSYEIALAAYRRGDYERALTGLRPLAEQGDADAQRYLGLMFENGRGVVRDYGQAVEWYIKAAGQGNVPAQTQLGYLYLNGVGIAADQVRALEWLRKAAGRGDSYAQCTLGEMYENARGVTRDYAQAMEWYAKAAEQGDARAEVMLGLMYERGSGVAQDYGRAADWYRKAAERGYVWGQSNLGMLYAYGRGVALDYKLAVEWHRKAADKGFANSQYDLGYAYESGLGVDADLQQAREWYGRAARQGHSAALARLNSLSAGDGLIGAFKRVMGLVLR